RASPLMRSTAPSTGHRPRCGRQSRPRATDGPFSAVLCPVVAPQEVRSELIEAWAADLAHDKVDLAAENIERLFDAPGPTRDRTVKRRATEEHELGAEAEGDQDIGATAHAAVEHHG